MTVCSHLSAEVEIHVNNSIVADPVLAQVSLLDIPNAQLRQS